MAKKNKKSNPIRKIIYFILFALIIGAFIYLSNKYEDLSVEKEKTFTSYYKALKSDKFEVISSNELLSYLNKGKHLIFIGNSNSPWSKKYASILTDILDELNVDASYYDLENDKTQKNSKYYKIREELSNYLVTTDSSQNNLLAPSFYIVDNGKVKYYNIDTVAMKNTESVSVYWTKEVKDNFKLEISKNIEKYYLNNQDS